MELSLPNGEACISDPSKKFKTTFEIICSEKALTPRFDNSTKFGFHSDSCENRIKLYSKEACPDFSFYGFFNSIVKNKFIFGPILFAVGFFLCFFGYKFYNILCVITGVLLVSFVILFLVLSNINIEFSSWAFWLLIISVVLVGALVGYLFNKYELFWIVDMALAGFAGYLFGLFLFNFFLNQIGVNPKIVFFSSIVFSIILFLFLVLMFRKFMVILCSSFNGAYSLVRGASLLIGGFPSEKEVMDLIEKKEWGQLNKVFIFPIIFF